MSAASLEALVKRLEAVTTRLEAYEPRGGAGAVAPPVTPSAPAAGGSPASLAAFDALLSGELAALGAAARAVGGPVQAATELLDKAFRAERAVVAAIAACKQPGAPALQKLVAPVGAVLVEVSAKTEGKRTDEFNHYKALAEASQALTWVAFLPGSGAPQPGALADEAWASAEFWVNKVLMQYRGKDERQVAWAGALKALFVALRTYIKAHHATGPAWSRTGGDVADFKAGAPGSAPPAGGAAPPPPPPPPPPGGPGSLIPKDAAPAAAPAARGGSGNMSALFGEINKGESVASGLRKVTDDMKAKNRADRSGAVPASAAPAGGAKAAAAPGAAAAAGTPRLACEGGRKWVVEHQVDAKGLEVTEVNPKQTVYVYNCRGSVVQIKGKVNSVCLDKCSRTAVVFADVVASVEVVNCSAVELQATGCVPTVAVDNCAGVQLYLGAASLGCAITTAKSSSVNVLIPGASADDDLVEAPIPEQFVTTYVDGKWRTEAVAHSAG